MSRNRAVGVLAFVALLGAGAVTAQTANAQSPCDLALAEAAELESVLDNNTTDGVSRRVNLEADLRNFIADVRARCVPPTTTTTAPTTTTVAPTTTTAGPTTTAPPAPGECAPFPAFPDADCTGPTGTLPLYTGSEDFRTDGQVVENVEIRTSRGLYVPASNVTFRNVRIVYTGPLAGSFTLVNLNNNTGTVFEDCELDGQGNVDRAITGSSVTVRGCEIHRFGNAIETPGPLVVEGNFIHDIRTADGTGWHADGIQTPMGSDNVTVRHNTILLTGPETGAVNIMGSAANPAENVTIEHNLLAGGGWTVYAGPGPSSYRVVDNHFSTRTYPKVGYYGVWYWSNSEDGELVRSGNVIHETGAAANDNNFGAGTTTTTTPTTTTTTVPTTTTTAPSGGGPGPDNTGVPAGTTLTPSGSLTISQPGAVVDALDITGTVNVTAPNVTIRRTRIRSNQFTVVDSNSTGLVIEDSEIGNRPVAGQPNCHNAIGDHDFTLRRVEITGCENGANIGGGNNVLIEDSWIHALDTVGPSRVFGNDPHTDGIQVGAGSSNLTIRRNVIRPQESGSPATTAAIITYTGSGSPNNRVTIEDNVLDGSRASYSLYANRQQTSEFRVNRNRMGRGVAGYTACVRLGITVAEFNGNVDAVTGAPVGPDNGAGGSCSN